MSEQAFNLKFVAEVEKFPVVYNYKLKGYSKKHITETAWSEIAKEVQLSVSECKEKWKNLRSVFVRHLKPAARGTDAHKKKPYYLSEAMKFTLPFIRTVGRPDGYLSEVADDLLSTRMVSQQLSDDCVPNSCPTDEEEEYSASLTSPLLPEVHISTHLVESKYESPLTPKPASSPALIKKRKKNKFTDLDKSFDYLADANNDKITFDVKDPQGKKMFLLSLLPEIKPLTDSQMRLFRRGVLRLIDDIRFSQKDGFQVPMPSQYSSYPSSSHSSLHDNATSPQQESYASRVDE